MQKEYFKEKGNYKGDGKYSNDYVRWLEDKVLIQQQVNSVDLADVGGNEVACDHNFNRVSDCQIKCDKCGEDYKA